MRKTMKNEIISLLRKRKEGFSFQRIARELHVLPREKQLLVRTLRRLENLGVVLKRKRQYYVPAKSNIVRGRLITSRRGYGFVSPEGGSSEDIFVPARHSGGAFSRRNSLNQ